MKDVLLIAIEYYNLISLFEILPANAAARFWFYDEIRRELLNALQVALPVGNVVLPHKFNFVAVF